MSLLLIVALLAAGSVAAYYTVRSLSYYPTLRIETPSGFAFTVVQERRDDRAGCGDANDRFLQPLDTVCESCKVVYARCRRRLEGVELTLIEESPPPLYVVAAPGVRMAVTGPLEHLKEVCEDIAEGLVKSGLTHAACAYPRGTPSAPALQDPQHKGPGKGPR